MENFSSSIANLELIAMEISKKKNPIKILEQSIKGNQITIVLQFVNVVHDDLLNVLVA